MSAKNVEKSTQNDSQETSVKDVSEGRLRRRKQSFAENRLDIYQEHNKVRRKRRKAKLYVHANSKARKKRLENRVRKKRDDGQCSTTLLPLVRNSPEFRDIVKYFIEPLADATCLSGFSMQRKLDIIFGSEHRDVVPAVAIARFVMPGAVWNSEDGSFRAPTTSEANIPVGAPLFIRIDDRMPERIDIQVLEKEELIFSLNSVEYKSIIQNFREINGCHYRLDPPGEALSVEKVTTTP